MFERPQVRNIGEQTQAKLDPRGPELSVGLVVGNAAFKPDNGFHAELCAKRRARPEARARQRAAS